MMHIKGEEKGGGGVMAKLVLDLIINIKVHQKIKLFSYVSFYCFSHRQLVIQKIK